MGLGKYVVEGERAFRFSPKYPNIEINSPKDQNKNTQVRFFAVDLKKQKVDLMEGDFTFVNPFLAKFLTALKTSLRSAFFCNHM